MPFITFPSFPETLGEGRSAWGVSAESDTHANWVAEVEAVMPGETEITQQQYDAAVAANAAHNAAIPPPPPPPPTAEEQALAAVQAIPIDDIADPIMRAFAISIRDLVAGRPTVIEQAATNVTRGIP